MNSESMIGNSTLEKYNHPMLRRNSDEECKSHKLYEIDQKIFFESTSLLNTEQKGTDLTQQTNSSNAIEKDKLEAVIYPTSTDCDDQSDQNVQNSTHENYTNNGVAFPQVDKKRVSECTKQEGDINEEETKNFEVKKNISQLIRYFEDKKCN